MGIELATLGTIATIASGVVGAGTGIASLFNKPSAPESSRPKSNIQPLSSPLSEDKKKKPIGRGGILTSPLGDTSEQSGARAKLLGN